MGIGDAPGDERALGGIGPGAVPDAAVPGNVTLADEAPSDEGHGVGKPDDRARGDVAVPAQSAPTREAAVGSQLRRRIRTPNSSAERDRAARERSLNGDAALAARSGHVRPRPGRAR